MSRSSLLFAAGISSLAVLSVPAMAQPAPPPQQSSGELVCQLAGECDTAATSGDAAATAGETAASPRGTPRTGATRGFSVRQSNNNESINPGQPAFSIRQSNQNTRQTTRYGTSTATKASTRYSAAARPAAVGAVKAPGRADLLITFVTGSSTLTEQAKVNAQQMILALQSPALAGTRFMIEGHTDAVGAAAYNLNLSRERAQAVVDYLVANGADRTRFDVAGYGFERPIDKRHPRAAANRRVEVVKIK